VSKPPALGSPVGVFEPREEARAMERHGTWVRLDDLDVFVREQALFRDFPLTCRSGW
jgi:hypothetical protein